MGDGTLIQWGVRNTTGLTNYIDLPIAFKDTSYTVFANAIANSNSVGNITSAVANTTTSITIGVNNYTIVTSFHWLAIGRWK